MINPFTALPASARKGLYIAYGVVALVVGAVDVFYGDGDPSWLEGAQNVVAYLALPFGALAASNTPASKPEVREEAREMIEEAVAHEDDLDDDLLDDDHETGDGFPGRHI